MSNADPLSNVLNAWSTWAGGLPGGAAVGNSPLDALMTQAHLASGAALLRSGQRAAKSWLAYTQAAAASPGLEGRIDAAREHLRQLLAHDGRELGRHALEEVQHAHRGDGAAVGDLVVEEVHPRPGAGQRVTLANLFARDAQQREVVEGHQLVAHLVRRVVQDPLTQGQELRVHAARR